jgi:hypothetical protein
MNILSTHLKFFNAHVDTNLIVYNVVGCVGAVDHDFE